MKIIGHRGAKALAPENTLASIQAALDCGIDEIEIDVRVSRDNIVVLSHDPYLLTSDGKKRLIHTMPYADIVQVKPDATTLSEAMDLASGKCRLIVDVKSRVKLKEVISQSQVKIARGFPVKDLSFASFDFTILKLLRKSFPDVELVVNERWSGVRAAHRARALGTKRISMNQLWLWRGFLRQMHGRGFELSPYTVSSPRQATRWSPYIYGVITDNPTLVSHRQDVPSHTSKITPSL